MFITQITKQIKAAQIKTPTQMSMSAFLLSRRWIDSKGRNKLFLLNQVIV
jgi:hypothetical protein